MISTFDDYASPADYARALVGHIGEGVALGARIYLPDRCSIKVSHRWLTLRGGPSGPHGDERWREWERAGAMSGAVIDRIGRTHIADARVNRLVRGSLRP